MFILPIGHEQDTVRRWPWVSIIVVALCLLVHIAFSFGGTSDQQAAIDTLEDVLVYWQEHPYLALDPQLAAMLGIDPDELVAEDAGALLAQRGQTFSDPESAPGYQPQIDQTDTHDPSLEPVRPHVDMPTWAPPPPLDAPDPDAVQQGGMPQPWVVVEQQRTLDELVAAWRDARRQVPIYRFGLVPAEWTIATFLTSIFVHAGWMHLLGNLFFLWLAGPPLEDVWGRPMFGAFYLSVGLLAGLLWVLRYPDSSIPLIGASGAIAGLMGAFAVRYWSTRITCWYLFFVFLRPYSGTFRAPAWGLLGLWFGRELLSAAVTDRFAGASGGVANWVHVWGFFFGALVAFTAKRLRAEERWLQPALNTKLGIHENRALVEAHELETKGDLAGAYEEMVKGLAQRADDVDLIVARWDLAKRLGKTAEAAPALLRLLRHELRSGERELVFEHWHELREHAPGLELDLDLRLRLTDFLHQSGWPELGVELLGPTIERLDPNLATPPLARLAKAAVASAVPGADQVCRLALARADLGGADREVIRQGLEMATTAAQRGIALAAGAIPLAAEDPGPLAVASLPPKLPPLPVAGQPPPPAAAPSRSLVVYPGKARALQADRLTFDLPGQGGRALELAKVRALAAGQIAALGDVVVDLLLDDPAGAGKLRALRLRGSELDAGALLAGEAPAPGQTATVTLPRLLAELVSRTGARALPDTASAVGRPFAQFGDLADYERRVLGATSGRP